MTNMLIVESGAKARTIQKYLGKDWRVHACGGHIQTLPQSGKDGRKAFWASRPGELPKPRWEWTERGEGIMRQIWEDAEKHKVKHFYLAPDPDREGEFIAWRLRELLADRGITHRMTFQEITKQAVLDAVDKPTELDMNLVESALVRKFLDRLVGFRASKFARPYVPGGRVSMGRVQTPSLGFVVERELEREAHVPIPYWEVRAAAATIPFQVRFHESSDPDAWRDNDDKHNPARTAQPELATSALESLEASRSLKLTEVKAGTRSRKPKPAFSTDALLQDAGSRWGWSPKRTMGVAKVLYEAGHITYLRTDSTRIADVARDAARAHITKTWGEPFLGPGVEGKKGASKVQDAHEAIRPTDLSLTVSDIDGDDGVKRLFGLIRARFLASQMAPAVFQTRSLRAAVEGFERPLTGSVSWRVEAGWQAAYVDIDGPRVTEPPAADLSVGVVLPLDPGEEEAPNPERVEGETQPPPRFRAHTLVKAMKDSGIGRPSTYAKTVEKLEDRGYIEIDSGQLVPTPRGRSAWLVVAPFYRDEDMDQDLFSVEFTEEMERVLDAIETGEISAANVWERYREQIRAMHNQALEQRRQGTVTKALAGRLRRMLENAPDKYAKRVPDEISTMKQADAQELLGELRDLGIKPAPSERQLAEIERLLGVCSMKPEDAAVLIELTSLAEIQTSSQASELIDALRQRQPSTKPASKRQLGAIRKLVKNLDLDEQKACALVDVEEGYDVLTGGRNGTASALITTLKKMEKEAKEAKKAPRAAAP